ncbi:MAG: aminotransferase class I/II-fold pyridoxal phosphate-dependent enzyme [Prevotella sp.]|nr:aminotransferase class I/II-fold pyridoxal phosphate-dependent enzyme [Prevotella sp.]
MVKGHGDDSYSLGGDVRICSDFSSNICAHGDHHQLVQHLSEHASQLIAHYPEPEAWTLERLLAEHHAINPECVIVTSGATEAIYLVAQAFRLKPVIPFPTFSEYADACRHFRYKDGNHTICWVCNPNNPTGRVYGQHEIEMLSVRHDVLVIDQSYEDYTDAFIWTSSWAARLPNVILLHSMTKSYAVPGLRVGYITCAAPLAKVIRRYLRPWSVNALALEAARFLLEHDELKVRPDLAEAQRLHRNLKTIGGLRMMATRTNFMLGCLNSHTASWLKQQLIQQYGILIRDASNFRGLTEQYFRIAAQTPKENDALLQALQQLLSGGES